MPSLQPKGLKRRSWTVTPADGTVGLSPRPPTKSSLHEQAPRSRAALFFIPRSR